MSNNDKVNSEQALEVVEDALDDLRTAKSAKARRKAAGMLRKAARALDEVVAEETFAEILRATKPVAWYVIMDDDGPWRTYPFSDAETMVADIREELARRWPDKEPEEHWYGGYLTSVSAKGARFNDPPDVEINLSNRDGFMEERWTAMLKGEN